GVRAGDVDGGALRRAGARGGGRGGHVGRTLADLPGARKLQGVSAFVTELGVDAETPAPAGGDIEEDEAVEDGQLPAVHVGDPVPVGEGPVKVDLEEGDGHLARGDEGRDAGEEPESNQDAAGELDDAPHPRLRSYRGPRLRGEDAEELLHPVDAVHRSGDEAQQVVGPRLEAGEEVHGAVD